MQPTERKTLISRMGTCVASALRGTLNSTLILTCLILMAADATLAAVKPLKYFNATGFTPLDQNPLVSKLPEFIHSRENPDILLLGSSLTLVPAVRCDDELTGARARYDVGYRRNYINCYSKAEYFRQSLESALKQPVQVRNLGVIASIFSDQELILERTLKSGKKPKLVICCTAPRDFLDNYRSVVEQTPVFQVLADLSTIHDMSARGASLADISSRAMEHLWHFYLVRADYRTVALAATAQLLDHPQDLFHAGQNKAKVKAENKNHDEETLEIGIMDHRNKPVYVAPPNTLNDLSIYKNVYQPVNLKLFNTQSDYLVKMLKLCKQNKITVLIVNMPLTEANKKLLPADAWARYKALLVNETAKYDAAYLDADIPGEFSMSDFEDSCHMNSRGGRKFYKILVEALSARNRSQSLAANHGSI
jgi:Protein of unknown function (DUF1574)